MKRQLIGIKKILVVEDEPFMLKLLSDEFVREGFDVFEAKDGQEGLQIALVEHPDLILLDILMPKKDGMRMLRELRKEEWGKHVPVIILTNLNNTANISEALKNGAYDFLVKSDYRIESVVSRVKALLFSSPVS